MVWVYDAVNQYAAIKLADHSDGMSRCLHNARSQRVAYTPSRSTYMVATQHLQPIRSEYVPGSHVTWIYNETPYESVVVDAATVRDLVVYSIRENRFFTVPVQDLLGSARGDTVVTAPTAGDTVVAAPTDTATALVDMFAVSAMAGIGCPLHPHHNTGASREQQRRFS
jgi:hypothetical protein